MKVKGFGRREFLEADVISVYLWVIAMIAVILIGVGSSKNNVFFNQSQFFRWFQGQAWVLWRQGRIKD